MLNNWIIDVRISWELLKGASFDYNSSQHNGSLLKGSWPLRVNKNLTFQFTCLRRLLSFFDLLPAHLSLVNIWLTSLNFNIEYPRKQNLKEYVYLKLSKDLISIILYLCSFILSLYFISTYLNSKSTYIFLQSLIFLWLVNWKLCE